MRIEAVPLSQAQANEYVARYHRHHDPVRGDKFRVGASINGELAGVVQVGRPVARMLDDGKTVEVVRLCTNGEKDVCSFLYGKAARIAKELGYEKIITYILDTEPGTSLKAAGWIEEQKTKGGEWTRPSRKRATTAPTAPKRRYAKILRG